jgi:hypothetical protein
METEKERRARLDVWVMICCKSITYVVSAFRVNINQSSLTQAVRAIDFHMKCKHPHRHCPRLLMKGHNSTSAPTQI